MKRFALLFALMFIIAACVPSTTNNEPAANDPVSNPTLSPTPTDDPALLPTLFPNQGNNTELTRIDEQGAVVFDITPLNLGTPADTLEFAVSMNTHSVDLSMDLASLATLTTDTGLSIPATKWDAVPGGHHVAGTLIFPAMQDGKSILEGAGKLTLTILNVDAASRVFEWDLQ